MLQLVLKARMKVDQATRWNEKVEARSEVSSSRRRESEVEPAWSDGSFGNLWSSQSSSREARADRYDTHRSMLASSP
jgi:hypothetical protein